MTDAPRTRAYRLAADTFGDEELSAAIEVLRTRRVTMGEHVRAFEQEFARWVGARHAVMVNSGSSANLLMVDALLRRTNEAMRLQPGDEVLVPGLAWPTTVWPLAQLGLIPVWVDVDPATLGLDLESAHQALGARTKAILPIHPLGRALDMDAHSAFCDANGLTLIEDTCESLGAHWGDRHAGTFGLMGSFSFYFSHHISTIEGGMLVTDDDGLNDDLRSLRSHGWVRDRSDRQQLAAHYADFDDRFLFVMPGYNVRPTELQGAIGRVQLRRLDGMLEARAALAHDVATLLAEHVPWLELIGADTFEADERMTGRARSHSWMALPLRVTADAPLSRGATMEHLERQGVETRPLLAGNLFRHPASKSIASRLAPSLRHCDELLDRAFMIGCHPVLESSSRETLEAALRSLAKA